MRERSPTCYILAKTIENWDEEIFPRIQSLADHPDMGRLVPELDQTFLGVSRRLSDLALIYCGKVIFARSPDHFC